MSVSAEAQSERKQFFDLLGLSRELRDQIYDYMVPTTEAVNVAIHVV